LEFDDVNAQSATERATLCIREWILSGELAPGRRMPSERALAERLNVKRGAVRAAFAALEQDGLLLSLPRRTRTVRRAVPSEAPSTILTRSVVALVPAGFAHHENGKGRPSWQGRLQQALTATFMDAGLAVLLVTDQQLDGSGLDQLVLSPPRGLAVAQDPGQVRTREALLRALHVGEIPIAVWGDEHSWPGCDMVVSDHETGSRTLTEWLVARGCRRLLRCRPTGAGERDWMVRRDRGFESALQAAGLPVLPPLEVPGLDEASSDRLKFERNAHLLAGYLYPHLRGEQPVDALLAQSDTYLAEIAAACRIVEKDPRRDVVLAGYDNCWADCVERQWDSTPPRVTVDKNDGEIGKALAGLLLDRIADKLPLEPQRRVVAQRVVIVEGG
jgi:DNA-binding LacI/PurR family transcriptional regulator